MPSPRRVLFHRHDHGDDQHPQQIGITHRKHEHHERPATSDTKDPMTPAKSECLPMLPATLPMFHHEAEGRPAFFKAPVFQRTELKCSGNQ
jgi:hypothetical protein